MISLKVHGLKELEEQLLKLPTKVSKRVLRKAARLAMQPVLRDAQAAAPVDTGILRDSIRIANGKAAGNAAISVGLRIAVGKGGSGAEIAKAAASASRDAVGLLSGKRAAKKARRGAWRKSAHWRWHFVELGTSKVSARPFLRPALDKNASKVIEILKAELAEGITRAVKRERRKAGK